MKLMSIYDDNEMSTNRNRIIYLPSLLAPFPTYGIPSYCRQYLLEQRSLECAYELLNMSIFDNFKARVIWQILGFDLDTRGKVLFHCQNVSFGMKICNATDYLMHFVFFHFFLANNLFFWFCPVWDFCKKCINNLINTDMCHMQIIAHIVSFVLNQT